MPQQKSLDHLTRRELAELLNIHQDTVTRVLRNGLASAVMVWGGSGKEMSFSRRGAIRWIDARDCRRDGGQRCRQCSRVLEDVMAIAEHLLEERHGFGACDECRPPGSLCQPCTLTGLGCH